MGVAAIAAGGGLDEAFRHEALFYSGEGEFVGRMGSFVRQGLAVGEPVLILVVPRKIELLRAELGRDNDRVMFGDMAEIGRNPGRIIPLWREFVAGYAKNHGRVRGIGEPIWATRTSEELVESQRHEALINLAFTGAPAWVLCPYDLESLEPAVIDEAFRSHPIVSSGESGGESPTYAGLGAIDRPFADPLGEPPRASDPITIRIGSLTEMRAIVADRATDFGLPCARVVDLVLAVNEVATNSLRHGLGVASLRYWSQCDDLIFEVADQGRIAGPLVGRQRPSIGDNSGYGLWMANQLCDLVQLRSFATGSVVRLRMTRR